MRHPFKTLGICTGLFLCTIVLGGAEGGCDIVIGDGDGDTGDGDTGDNGDGDNGDGDNGDGDGDNGDGDGDNGDGDGDIGDGDGDTTCRSDDECGPGQLCAMPDCAAICEQDPDNPDECRYDCGDGVCIDINPGPCAAVDCAPGYTCQVETYCWEGDCDPGSDPNCWGECEEEAICVPDYVEPGECYSDEDCGPGYYCNQYDYFPAPCYDENGDGICEDEDGLVAPMGYCEVITDPPACAYIDCGPGYTCEEEVFCYPCDCVDEDCGGCDNACEVNPVCVPVGNEECYELPAEQCNDVPGCHVEEIWPPCAAPEPEPCDPDDDNCGNNDPIPPPQCEPVLTCVPDYNPGEGSCAGQCGDVGSNGQCFCDDLCMQYGDCCEDFVDYCEDTLPPGCDSDEMCGDGYVCEYVETCYDDLGNGQECFIEGVCLPVNNPDPCNDIPVQICEEVQGCELLELQTPCQVGPDGTVVCPDEAELICVTADEPPPPEGCTDAAGQDLCGPDGRCVEETYCLDYCDQTVPDPECCFTESYCEYDEPPACIQVETPATNPATGNCVVFPTPCDVPDGWEEGCSMDGTDGNGGQP